MKAYEYEHERDEALMQKYGENPFGSDWEALWNTEMRAAEWGADWANDRAQKVIAEKDEKIRILSQPLVNQWKEFRKKWDVDFKSDAFVVLDALINEQETIWECERKLASRDAMIEKLSTTISFFASVIKSGESWSDECEKRLRDMHETVAKRGEK